MRSTDKVVSISFKLDARILQEIDAIAQRDERTRSGTLRMALLEYVTLRQPTGDRRPRKRKADE